jgi:hypothetical protein
VPTDKFLSSEKLYLLSTISQNQSEMDTLRGTISEQRITIYQLSLVAAKFDSLREFMHKKVGYKKVEAGGTQMLLVVLFLGVLAMKVLRWRNLGLITSSSRPTTRTLLLWHKVSSLRSSRKAASGSGAFSTP